MFFTPPGILLTHVVPDDTPVNFMPMLFKPICQKLVVEYKYTELGVQSLSEYLFYIRLKTVQDTLTNVNTETLPHKKNPLLL